MEDKDNIKLSPDIGAMVVGINKIGSSKCPEDDCSGWVEYQRSIGKYDKFKCCACGAVEIKG